MPVKTKTPPPRSYFYAVGKRKTAIACVKLFAQGKGEQKINQRDLQDYFTLAQARAALKTPFKVLDLSPKDYDFEIKVQGSGHNAQMEACLFGLAKALLTENYERRKTLKSFKFLTSDSRQREAKKPGLKRARKAPQFSKR